MLGRSLSAVSTLRPTSLRSEPAIWPVAVRKISATSNDVVVSPLKPTVKVPAMSAAMPLMTICCNSYSCA